MLKGHKIKHKPDKSPITSHIYVNSPKENCHVGSHLTRHTAPTVKAPQKLAAPMRAIVSISFASTENVLEGTTSQILQL